MHTHHPSIILTEFYLNDIVCRGGLLIYISNWEEWRLRIHPGHTLFRASNSPKCPYFHQIWLLPLNRRNPDTIILHIWARRALLYLLVGVGDHDWVRLDWDWDRASLATSLATAEWAEKSSHNEKTSDYVHLLSENKRFLTTSKYRFLCFFFMTWGKCPPCF